MHVLFLKLFFALFINRNNALENRVFNATKLRYDVHTYLVKLDINFGSFYGMCSGSIVTASHVVTSAHCVANEIPYSVAIFHHVNNSMKKIADADAEDIAVHPKYGTAEFGTSAEFDLAVLKTKSPMTFSKQVRAIRLAKFPPKITDAAIIAGFGESEFAIGRAREGAVAISRCPYWKLGSAICSLNTTRAGDGDSGGALVYKKRLAGVTSASCTQVYINQPCITIYTNVASNLDWIHEQIHSK